MGEHRYISRDFQAADSGYYYSDFDNLKRKDLRIAFVCMGISAIVTAVIGYYSVKLLLMVL